MKRDLNACNNYVESRSHALLANSLAQNHDITFTAPTVSGTCHQCDEFETLWRRTR